MALKCPAPRVFAAIGQNPENMDQQTSITFFVNHTLGMTLISIIFTPSRATKVRKAQLLYVSNTENF